MESTTKPSKLSSGIHLDVDLIPTEIWLHIIERYHLSPSDITNLTLVCTSFRYVAQPLLFHEIIITQLRLSSELLSQHDLYQQRFLERLEFVGSSRMSPAVKSIILRTRTHPLASDVLPSAGTEENVDRLITSIATLWDKLPTLLNLRSFTISDVTLSNNHLILLSHLPQLDHLSLTRCIVDESVEQIPHFRLKSFTMHPDQSRTEDPSLAWWINSLHPSIEELSLWLPTFHDECLGQLTMGQTLYNLRTLRVLLGPQHRASLEHLLQKCPSIEELEFLVTLDDDDPTCIYKENNLLWLGFQPLPLSLLPKLETIIGPWQYIIGFVQSNQPLHVCLSQPPPQHGSFGTFLALYSRFPKTVAFTLKLAPLTDNQQQPSQWNAESVVEGVSMSLQTFPRLEHIEITGIAKFSVQDIIKFYHYFLFCAMPIPSPVSKLKTLCFADEDVHEQARREDAQIVAKVKVCVPELRIFGRY